MSRILDNSHTLNSHDAINKAFFSMPEKAAGDFRAMWAEIQDESQGHSHLSKWFLNDIARNIAGIERLYQEADKALENRLYSFLRRGKLAPWNTAAANRAFLSYYFPLAEIYSVTPALKSGLIANGNFEQTIGDEWTVTNGSQLNKADGAQIFAGLQVLGLAEFGQVAQTASSVRPGHYCLQFAHHGGGIHVMVSGSQGYWEKDSASGSGLPEGSWGKSPRVYTYKATQDWRIRKLCFRVDRTTDIHLDIITGEGNPLKAQTYASWHDGVDPGGSAFWDYSALYSPGSTGKSGKSAFVYIDDVRLGSYESPSIEYTIREINRQVAEPDGDLSLCAFWHDGRDIGGAARDHSYVAGSVGGSVTGFSERHLKEIIGTIRTSGCETKVRIIEGCQAKEAMT